MCKTPWWHHLVLVILLRTVKSHTAVTDVCALQKDEFLRLIINSIRNDLISRNEAFQCLALGFIGNGQSLSTIAVLPKHTSSLCICCCLLYMSILSTPFLIWYAVGGQEMASLLAVDVMALVVYLQLPHLSRDLQK